MIVKFFCVCLVCASGFAFGNDEKLQIRGELYSETYYDSRFDGAVIDTRFYNYFEFFEKRLRPYLGVHGTRDLSNDGAPLAIENAYMPAAGLEVQLLNKPYVFAFTQKRWIYRTESLNNEWQDEEVRIGLIYYHKQFHWKKTFFETYGEWINIDRVSTRSVFTTWLKAGVNIPVSKPISLDPFFEGFTRQSGDPGYGPLENEIRAGLRLNTSFIPNLYVGSLVTYSLASNINPGKYDALLVISSRFY